MKDFDYNVIIDKYYPADRPVRGILLRHSRAVSDEAKMIVRKKKLALDNEVVEAAAMLHDIGIIATDAAGIDCRGTAPYLCHGAIGADMLRVSGAPEIYALVAERHTGAGLTEQEIAASGLELPESRIYMPESLLEKLICYADCFYSKNGDMQRKSTERVEQSMLSFGKDVLARFRALHAMFS